MPGSIPRSRASAGRVRIRRPNSTFPRRICHRGRRPAGRRPRRSRLCSLFRSNTWGFDGRRLRASPPRTSASSAGAAPGPRSANRGRRAVRPLESQVRTRWRGVETFVALASPKPRPVFATPAWRRPASTGCCRRLGQGTPRIAEVGLDVPLRQRRLHRHSRLEPCRLASPGHGLKDPRPSRNSLPAGDCR